eukprot:5557058-Prorocentrum_lima.AAC.1
MGALRKAVLMSVVVKISMRPLVRLRTILSNPMLTFCVEVESQRLSVSVAKLPEITILLFAFQVFVVLPSIICCG